MKAQKIFTMLVMSLFLIGVVSAANTVTLYLPGNNDVISGSSYQLNASLDTNTLNLTKANFYYSTDSGSTWTAIALNVTNSTPTNFTTTFDTTSLVDQNDTIFNVTVTNQTWVKFTENDSQGVDIDNGNPTASLSISNIHDGYKVGSGDVFTLGLSADTTIGINNCTAVFTNQNDGTVVKEHNIGVSGNACSNSSLTLSNVGLTQGEIYDVLIIAEDQNGDTTNSSSRTLNVLSAAGRSVVGTQKAAEQIGGGRLPVAAQNALNGLKNVFQNVGESIRNFFENLIQRLR